MKPFGLKSAMRNIKIKFCLKYLFWFYCLIPDVSYIEAICSWVLSVAWTWIMSVYDFSKRDLLCVDPNISAQHLRTLRTTPTPRERDKETDRQTDRQTDRDRETERQSDRQTGRQRDRQRQRNRETGRQSDRQTGRDRGTEREHRHGLSD